ncbi:hypothetical protein OS493_034032 [Desmophyllum pertusum]|uniref:PDZ domain-containing protein n=1 Tax=Desmophyllum pertusum TaxID=174260 RepID=A0A9X0CUY9_9CNID|nr:hypothetical protein OS493_034032 [Desmophyllum pertusum]
MSPLCCLGNISLSPLLSGRIIQGSPADRCRQLHVGDRLVAVNNASIVGVHHSDIVDTIKQSGRTVTLRIAQQRPLGHAGSNKRRGTLPKLSKNTKPQFTTAAKGPPRVAPKPSREKVLMAQEERRRKEDSFNDVRNDMRRRSNPDIPSRPPQPSQNYTGGVRDVRGSSQQTMEVELARDSQGYGFSIRGGRELNLPIFVLRMAEGGVAHRDGRLRVGDEILEINGRSTVQIPHADAINLIKSGGNRVRLVIHRTNKPVYLDGIPNGGQAIAKGGSLPRANWKNPSYHGMYQS